MSTSYSIALIFLFAFFMNERVYEYLSLKNTCFSTMKPIIEAIFRGNLLYCPIDIDLPKYLLVLVEMCQ